jgi:hypothetical protein
MLPAGTSVSRLLVEDPDGIGVLSNGGGIAADCEHVYWVSGSSRIMRVRYLVGVATPPEIVADNQDHPADVAVDDTGVYWVNYGSEPGTGIVTRMRKE